LVRSLIAATTVRIDAFREPEIIDTLHVLERAMHHFFIWVEIGKTRAAKNEQVDEDYKQAGRACCVGNALSARSAIGHEACRCPEQLSAHDLRRSDSGRVAGGGAKHISILADAGVLDVTHC
jgi:hypothetical protein